MKFGLGLFSLMLLSGAHAFADECPIRFEKAERCASLEWTTGPRTQGDSAFTLRFWNPASSGPKGPYSSPSDAAPDLELFMPEHHHGSRPPKMIRTANGVYAFTKVSLYMEGLWELRFKLLSAQGTLRDEQTLRLTLPSR